MSICMLVVEVPICEDTDAWYTDICTDDKISKITQFVIRASSLMLLYLFTLIWVLSSEWLKLNAVAVSPSVTKLT
jgi:hypothetical protein